MVIGHATQPYFLTQSPILCFTEVHCSPILLVAFQTYDFLSIFDFKSNKGREEARKEEQRRREMEEKVGEKRGAEKKIMLCIQMLANLLKTEAPEAQPSQV